MPEKTIKHFIVSRFFPRQDPNYPHDVFHVDFLSKQLNIAKNNILRTLENQTNKNFEPAFRFNERHLTDPKYRFIFSELRRSTDLPLIIDGSLYEYAKMPLKIRSARSRSAKISWRMVTVEVLNMFPEKYIMEVFYAAEKDILQIWRL